MHNDDRLDLEDWERSLAPWVVYLNADSNDKVHQ